MASCQSLLDAEDWGSADLLESRVDSDDEDFTKSVDSLTFQDTLKDCLEKDPSERTEKDIEMLLDFVKQLEAFAKMTLAVQRDICSVMVFAAVENAGTELMEEGDEMDSWCVIIDGCVEVVHPSGETEKLHVGDSFGIQPSTEKLYHRGVLRTCCDDCQFVCISQNDYYRILHQGEENIRRHEEGGHVVLVTELRGEHQVVIQGTPEKLIEQLVKDKSTYVEDFVLTHRTFIDDPLRVPSQLQEWFNDPNLKGRVSRIVLLWIQNHFNDFETSAEMMVFLETFLSWLEQEKMNGELNMLTTLLEMNARTRNVVVTRSSRDETLQFSIKGGSEQGFGIFVSQVDKHTKAEKSGLLRGDQILEVNGQNFETSPVTHEKALKILRDSTHLSITVKSNLIMFKELLHTADTSRRRCGRVSESTMVAPISILQLDHGASLPSRASKHHNKENKGCAKSRLHRVLTHFGQPIFNFLSENSIINGSLLESSLIPKSFNDNMAAAPPTNQNTDIVRSCHTLYGLKVYKADQTFKYLLVHAETTSKETVQQALKEFDICEPTCHYSLCEVSVGEGGLFKQSRLPDHMHNLAGRIGLNSRYYLKESGATDSLMPDELVPELIRDSKVQFLQLNSAQVAIQLTLQDFSIFKQIESTEYVDHIFKRQSRYGTPVLSRFAELVNREMFWVITEVCSELNVIRRSKIIKQFVKLARECKVCNNFNSMFAILSGLGYRSVARLKLSWERLPAKYQKMFSDLEEFMDTSRNMSKYRQYVSSKISNHPIIPFYPLVNKDLTFIHEGNETYIDGLINFEKLRKFSSVVRWLNSMCSCPYDLFTTLEQDGQTSSTAMKTLNLNLTSGTYQPNEDCSTLNRRNNSSVTLNAKKLFEEAQMVRRVKEYLNNIRVITDEEKLYVMSLMCEAPLRKRQPSPGVSNGNTTATRKNSSTGTKFGVDSALSVRKLLSLSEPIKYLTHQPRSLTQGPEAQHPAPGAPSKAKPRRGSFSFATSSPMLQQQQHSASTKTIDQRKKTVSDTVLKDTVR